MPRLLNIFCSLSAYIYISVGGGCVFSLSFSPVKKNSKKWGGGRKVGVEHFFAFFNFFSSMGTRFLPRHFTTKDQNKQIIFIYMIIWTTFTHFTNLHFIHCLVWFSCSSCLHGGIQSASTVSSVVKMAIQVRSCVE